MLNIDPVVQVNVHVGTSSASAGTFDVGAILTPDTGTASGTGGGAALSTTHRFAVYSKLADVLNGVTNVAPSFANTTDTYKAAAKYFGVDPAPASLVIVYYDTSSGTEDTPTGAMLDAIDKGSDFYGVYYIPAEEASATDIKNNIVNISSALLSQNRGVEFYGATGVVSTLVGSGGLFNDVAATGSKRAIGMYCTSAIDDAAGLMGAAMGLSRQNVNSAFALCYKSVASATVNNISQSEVELIKGVNANVFVQRTKTRAFVENGATASGLRFDEVLFIDRMAYDIQNTIYDMIANNPTKYPQADSTSVLFAAAISRILDTYYNAGVLAEAAWRGAAIGTIETGNIVPHGHAEFYDSFDTQSVADRALHKAMPITVLLCLSGSVETIVITVDVQT